MLYHGSATLIQGGFLRPNRNGLLYAAANPWMALAFIPPEHERQYDVGTCSGYSHIGETVPGAFRVFKRKGYIYQISATHFHDGNMSGEYITTREIPIISQHIVPDVWQTLQKIKNKANIDLLYYEEFHLLDCYWKSAAWL